MKLVVKISTVCHDELWCQHLPPSLKNPSSLGDKVWLEKSVMGNTPLSFRSDQSSEYLIQHIMRSHCCPLFIFPFFPLYGAIQIGSKQSNFTNPRCYRRWYHCGLCDKAVIQACNSDWNLHMLFRYGKPSWIEPIGHLIRVGERKASLQSDIQHDWWWNLCMKGVFSRHPHHPHHILLPGTHSSSPLIFS